jgi:hypothetical protein
MAKTLDEAGVKRLIQEIKGANKNLNTPIVISTANTTESKAQNVKNIADYVEKAKAAGVASVNGMAVTCIIDDAYSGVGYLNGDTNISICGIEIFDDSSSPMYFKVDPDGMYGEEQILMGNNTDIVTSDMLVKGARKPIILTPNTTEVDEETYQKLLSDNVDVVLKAVDGNLCTLTFKSDDNTSYTLYFTCIYVEGESDKDVYLYGYEVTITKNSPHTCSIVEKISTDLSYFLTQAGYLYKEVLCRVLQEIDLTGTDADRKAKLDKFKTDWKALTGANDLSGARFIGRNSIPDDGTFITGVLSYDDGGDYVGLLYASGYTPYKAELTTDGVLTITPLFSHLEAITIKTSNSTTAKAANVAAIKAYVDNLTALGVDVTKGYMIPIRTSLEEVLVGFIIPNLTGTGYVGLGEIANGNGVNLYISNEGNVYMYRLQDKNDDALNTITKNIVAAINEVNALAKGVKAFGAIELKASDNAANKAAITAYLKILTDAQVDTTNGYSVPVRITGNSQEYHGMLNIGTGVLLSGVVTDVNENHHYPFNVSTTDGVITFDENNYFLEKTSNEVTEMLDAIKYSYTAVPFTDTALSNKAQLEVFLSKVPNATVMHCTYKEIWAGALHKINGDWYGLLVKNINSPADNINVKLSADGTIVTSNSAQ